jgi:lipid-binding SYLF domain-containing protein
MKKSTPKLMLGICLALVSTAVAQAGDDNLIAESQQAIGDFVKADPSMASFIQKSTGYAVFPGVGKGGFVVGAARGKGILYDDHKPVGTLAMTQASIGAQAGAQSFAEIIFFESRHALEDFKSGKFEFSAEVSAVAVSAGASKAADYKQGVAVFTMAQGGLMFQASVGGQKFKYEPIK